MNKTEKILRSLRSRPEKRTPIATDMFIPNHSGDHSAGTVLAEPVNDNDIVNKKYADENGGGWVSNGSTTSTSQNVTLTTGSLNLPANTGYTTNIGIAWTGGSKLVEQTSASGAVDRMIYTPNGDAFEVLNEAGSVFMFSVHGGGSFTPASRVQSFLPLYVNGVSAAPSANLHVKHSTNTTQILAEAYSSTSKPLILKGAASQSATLTEWQDSSGTSLMSVTNNGRIVGYNDAVNDGSNTENVFGVYSNSASKWRFSVNRNGRLTFRPKTNDNTMFNLMDSGGNTIWQVGTLTIGMTINAPNSGYQALIVSGAVSQSANLQEWQNSSSTVLAKVNASGVFQPSGYNSSDGSAGVSGSFTTTDGKTVTVKDGIITSIV